MGRRGGIRPKLTKAAHSRPKLTTATYQLRRIKDPTTRRPRKADVPLVMLPNGVRLTQHPGLPRLPGQVGFAGERPVTEDEIARAADDNHLTNVESLLHDELPLNELDLPGTSKHRQKRVKQSERWLTQVIPDLIQPYLQLQRKTQSLCEEPKLKLASERCSSCSQSRLLKIWVVRFTSVWHC